MKKLVVASLALILIAFTACGNQSKDKATEQKAEKITTIQEAIDYIESNMNKEEA